MPSCHRKIVTVNSGSNGAARPVTIPLLVAPWLTAFERLSVGENSFQSVGQYAYDPQSFLLRYDERRRKENFITWRGIVARNGPCARNHASPFHLGLETRAELLAGREVLFRRSILDKFDRGKQSLPASDIAGMGMVAQRLCQRAK
jgi:hypothetical protein